MKIVGLMCAKDEGDLLPQVLTHLHDKVDHIYAYDDGSIDDTYKLLSSYTDYTFRAVDDPNRSSMNRGNYHHLLEKVKEDFKGEEVWCVLTMGDRFYLNKTPLQIVEEAGDHEAVQGVQLDFLRHRLDPWTKENDPYPDYHNIREICRWACIDERCIVAFKLHDNLSYASAKYPWPKGIKNVQYADLDPLYSLDMPYLEHQGRRSPEHFRQRVLSGQRKLSVKYKDLWDLSTWESTVETVDKFYAPYRVHPWVNQYVSLPAIVDTANMEGMKNKVNRRYFYWGLESAQNIAYIRPDWFQRGDL